MELSGLALKTACHLMYTQGGSVSLCVCLYGASNITHQPFGTLAEPRLVPFPFSGNILTASSVFSEDEGYTNSHENEVLEG